MASLLTFSLLYCIKQIDSMLLRICSVIDHRRHKNVVRTSVALSFITSCATFLSQISRMTGSEFSLHLVDFSFLGSEV